MTNDWPVLMEKIQHVPYDLKRQADSGIADMLNTLRKRALDICTFPSPGESAAVAIFSPKTAALCYDRVWLPWADSLSPYPRSITFFTNNLAHHILMVLVMEMSSIDFPQDILDPRWAPQLSDLVDATTRSLRKGSLAGDRIFRFTETIPVDPDLVRNAIASIVREVADVCRTMYGFFAVPVYPAVSLRDLAYEPGDSRVVVAALSNLDIVDENALHWEQVLEFRKDRKARVSFRRLSHWLDKEMFGKPTSFIEDEIACRLEDYRSVLKTHGMKTIKGTLERVLSGKTLTKAAGAAGASASLTGDVLWSTLAGAGYVVGDMLVSLLQSRLDLESEIHNYKDISFVWQIQSGVRKKRKPNE